MQEYKSKTNQELLVILSEVCTELEDRAVGIADINGKTEVILEQNGNIATCIHVGSNLGVSVVKQSLDSLHAVMFEQGEKLSSRTTLSRFTSKPSGESKDDNNKKVG